MRYALVLALATSWTASAHGEEAEPGVLREPGRTVVGQAPSARENSRGPAGMFGVDGGRASLRDLVRQEARKQGVDEKLALAIVNARVALGVEVNSPKGARGPMQLMPATAAMYGVTDICNPVQNVRGGVSYLKDLGAFQGNMMLVAAAYNAGRARLQAQGVPAISETVRYVASVTNSYYGLKTFGPQGKSRPP